MVVLLIMFFVLLYCLVGSIIARIMERMDICDDDDCVYIMLIWPVIIVFGLIAIVPFAVGRVCGDIIMDKVEDIGDKLRNRKD